MWKIKDLENQIHSLETKFEPGMNRTPARMLTPAYARSKWSDVFTLGGDNIWPQQGPIKWMDFSILGSESAGWSIYEIWGDFWLHLFKETDNRYDITYQPIQLDNCRYLGQLNIMTQKPSGYGAALYEDGSFYQG